MGETPLRQVAGAAGKHLLKPEPLMLGVGRHVMGDLILQIVRRLTGELLHRLGRDLADEVQQVRDQQLEGGAFLSTVIETFA